LVVDVDDETAKESYRRLRAAVLANASRGSLIVVGSHAPVGVVADVGANLAISLSEAGYSCAIVDAEVYRPRIATLYGVEGRQGLADVVLEASTLEDALVTRHGVSVMTAGTDPSAAFERYSGEAFQSMAAIVESHHDYTIVTVDYGSAIGPEIGRLADSVLLVVVEDLTTHEQVADVIERAVTQKVRVGGLVTVSRQAAKVS